MPLESGSPGAPRAAGQEPPAHGGIPVQAKSTAAISQPQETRNPLARMSQLEAALWWANEGIPVFPLWPIDADGTCTCGQSSCEPERAGKHPMVKWREQATTLRKRIRRWWKRHPDAGIGGATGDGLLVIDIDSKQGERDLKRWKLPRTTEVRTARGRHLYFMSPADVHLPNTDSKTTKARRLGRGIDTRGDGGFIVLPPSMHRSGKRYRLRLRDFAELPARVVARLQKKPRTKAMAMDVERTHSGEGCDQAFETMVQVLCNRIETARRSTRHMQIRNGTRRVAGYYHLQTGLSAEDVLERVDRAVDSTYSDDPKRRRGGYRTARDGWRDGLAHPFNHMPGVLKHADDGRPYVVAVEGRSGMYVATEEGGYAWHHSSVVVSSLASEWPGMDVQWQQTEKLIRRMTAVEALEEYGDSYAATVEYGYSGCSTFDRDTRTLSIASRFRSLPSARFHSEIDHYLEICCENPDDRELFRDYLTFVPDLDAPLPALLLWGPGGAGKQFIVSGMCEVFGVRTIDYDAAVQRFNIELAKRPVVWMDESTENKGKAGPFKRLVGNKEHRLEVKGGPVCTLIGYPRTVMAANDDDPGGLAADSHTADSDRSIGERLFHLQLSEKARTYLVDEIGQVRTYRENWAMKFAEHIMWLRENRKVRPQGRLSIMTNSERWIRDIATRHGRPGQVRTFLTDKLYTLLKEQPTLRARIAAQRKRANSRTEPLLSWKRSHPDHVFVSSKQLQSIWERVFNERPISVVQVTKILRQLGGARQSDQIRVGSKRVRGNWIPLSLLRDD